MDFSGLKSVALTHLDPGGKGWLRGDFPMEECKLNWLPLSAKEQQQSVLQSLLVSQKTGKEVLVFRGLHQMVQYIKISKWTWNCLTSEQSNTRSATNCKSLNRRRVTFCSIKTTVEVGGLLPTICLKISDLGNFMPFPFPFWQQWWGIKACNRKGECWLGKLCKWDPLLTYLLYCFSMNWLEKKGNSCVNKWD